VGRSDIQSYCFLETKKKSGDTYQRLKHMESTTDGFKLAEIDLQYRGP
jgi:ATP-dependent DNA helicase RecG